MVHPPRIELGRTLVHGILSPTRLPIPPRVDISGSLSIAVAAKWRERSPKLVLAVLSMVHKERVELSDTGF